MSKGTVTSKEAIIALEALGGRASSKEIEDHIIFEQRDGTLPDTYEYGGWSSYRLTINQVLQKHTPGYKKFKAGNSQLFKKVGPGIFELIDNESSSGSLIESGEIYSLRNRKISLENFKTNLKKNEENGELGELYVVEEERNLLREYDRLDLANKVKQVSKIDVTAGYDILSYDKDGNKKLIEVKSTSLASSKFYLTENEINTAKEIGSEYWLYRVINVKTEPQIKYRIQNPWSYISKGQIIISPISYSVELNLSQDPETTF